MSNTAIKQIKADLAGKYPVALVDALVTSYMEIKEQFYLGKHEPSELNGGKFVEACVRIIQYELTGNHTPIGTPIRNMTSVLRGFESQPSTHHESFRIHIPRLLLTIYGIRNRRGVGHLGGDVNPNLGDATLVSTTADWILSEIYRMLYTITLEEAQGMVEQLVRRKLLLIQQIGSIKRVLDPSLSYKDQTLVLLASYYPKPISDKELFGYVEYSNLSKYRSSILKQLHKARKINYDTGGECIILPPGLRYVEENYNRWLSKINNQ
ncbi:MAG: hypothetical protein ISS59_03365 [Desulfobacteraceae bacterium]|nr:hypothetical protein [Desulfobacteraceae bacterium]